MPVNIGLTFFFGGILGWILVKIMKPEPYLKGLVISMSASGKFFLPQYLSYAIPFLQVEIRLFLSLPRNTGNLGNLLLIMVHAICREKGSPFGDREVCRTIGLSYASFSMAVRPFAHCHKLQLLLNFCSHFSLVNCSWVDSTFGHTPFT